MITEILEKVDRLRQQFPQHSVQSLKSRVPIHLFLRASLEGAEDFNRELVTETCNVLDVDIKSSSASSQIDDRGGGGLFSTFNQLFKWSNVKENDVGNSDPIIQGFALASSPETEIQVIEWNMMDKAKFFPLSMLSSFTIRCFLHPFTVVKTKIQIQHKANLYTGAIDCFKKVFATEGIRGLYSGFWIQSFQIISGIFYMATYETVRHSLRFYGIESKQTRALIAGGCASMVGQTIIVPFDVISQHLMIIGMRLSNLPGGTVHNPLEIQYKGKSQFQVTQAIVQEIYRRDGLKGYYRGYLASLSTYVPNSALWWGFYQTYQDHLVTLFPRETSHLLIQCISGILGGWTTCIITNPVDACRARLQVQRLPSLSKTFTILWQEERYRVFTKGLSARMFQSGVFSVFIIMGYESIKRFSVNDEYRNVVRW